MKVSLSIVVILSVFSTTLATENEDEIKEETLSELNLTNDNSLEELPEVNQDTEVTRRKKSTTTTFCVEIRPSGNQKPFQVCEPSEPIKPGEPAPAPAYSAPAPAYYPSPTYTVQEQTKSQVSYQPTPSPAYKPASQPKPAPAYSAGGKTFTSSTSSSSKTFSSHVPLPYSTYRSKNEESGGEEQTHDHMHMMRMTHASAEEEDVNSAEMKSSHQMRSSGYGGSSHGSSFGGPSSYIPVLPKSRKSKHHGHNGLVITCQPNLAGYAHNVPSSFHHPPSIPSYSYRSSTPRGYDRYSRFQQQQLFGGGYQQGPVYKPGPPVYKPQPGAPLPVPQPPAHKPQSSIFEPASNIAYNPPIYNPPPGHSLPPPATFVSQITSSHQDVDSPASSDFGAFVHPQSQQGVPIPSAYVPPGPPPPPQLPPPSGFAQPSSAHPAFVSPAASSQAHQLFSSYSQAYAPVPQAQEHSAASFPSASIPASSVYASYAPPPATGQNIAPLAPSYIPPGTYRESEDETGKKTDTDHKEEKEKHTLKIMEGISHQRAAESQWESEVSTDRSLSLKTEEHLGHPHQEWPSNMRNDNAENLETESVAMNHLETNQIANNEIENSS